MHASYSEFRESSRSSEANICHLHHVTHEIFIRAQAAALPTPHREEPEDRNENTATSRRRRFSPLKPIGAGQAARKREAD